MLTKLQVAAYLAELRDSADGALHLRGRVEGVANQWRTSGEPVANQWRTSGEPVANQWLALEAELDALSRH
jgi:hypothetical protein